MSHTHAQSLTVSSASDTDAKSRTTATSCTINAKRKYLEEVESISNLFKSFARCKQDLMLLQEENIDLERLKINMHDRDLAAVLDQHSWPSNRDTIVSDIQEKMDELRRNLDISCDTMETTLINFEQHWNIDVP